jgi:hypothetical protein
MPDPMQMILTIAILIVIGVWIYTKAKKQTLQDTFEEIKNLFKQKEKK